MKKLGMCKEMDLSHICLLFERSLKVLYEKVVFTGKSNKN